ncbi:hypothetical protein [Celerinatantimonas diazotrophica]|uniref:Uncharacterized protein n=1 Tax=Celerinatantimonas diazotrophica TaxID=412034 RepID=A0A4R1K2T9_9GAMM|nr:hypothetical protein [Celerinatantimonas diazotrophica]TCK58157.1 hypothetical protein EV690_1866 [Celerinatantimonas diazotrophica]CAG9297771.1 hypothetical protein CEDIAZO_02962 [Celerinatantimonas diazotrophica]
MPKCNHPVGTACHCNSAQSCLTAIKVTTPNTTETFDGEHYLRANLIHEIAPLKDDKEQAVPVTINLIGSCLYGNDSDCPSGVVLDENGKVVQKLSASQTVNLTYQRDNHKAIPLLECFGYLCLSRSIDSIPYSFYKIRAHCCDGDEPEKNIFVTLFDDLKEIVLGHKVFTDITVAIHPQYSWTGSITLSWEKDEEQKEAQKEEKPKNKPAKKKPLSAIAHLLRDGFTIQGDLKVNAGGVTSEYTAKHTLKNDKEEKPPVKKKSEHSFEGSLAGLLSNTASEHTHSLSSSSDTSAIPPVSRDDSAARIQLLNAVTDVLVIVLLACYDQKGQDKIKMISYGFDSPEIKLQGSGQSVYRDGKYGIDSRLSISATPLFSAYVELDLLLALVASLSSGVGTVAYKAIQSTLDKLQKAYEAGNAPAYAGVKFNLKGALNFSTQGDGLLFEKKMDAPMAFSSLDTQTTVSFEGLGSVRAEAKVFIFHGLFDCKAKLTAIGHCELVTHNHGDETALDYVIYHDGIKAHVEITVSGGIHKGLQKHVFGSFDNADFNDHAKTYPYDWVLAQPKSKQDSTWKNTLFSFGA